MLDVEAVAGIVAACLIPRFCAFAVGEDEEIFWGEDFEGGGEGARCSSPVRFLLFWLSDR